MGDLNKNLIDRLNFDRLNFDRLNLLKIKTGKNNSSNLDELFKQEKDLLDTITDVKLKKVAEEEYNEMLSRYKEEKEKVKNDLKKESKLILDDLKKEFTSDIKSVEKINKLDFLSSLDGFDTFKNLISSKEENGGLPDIIKEQLLNIFENTDDGELESYFTMEIGTNIVDLESAKAFIDNFKKSIGLYKEEVNKILNLDFEKLSDNEKDYYLKEIDKYKYIISADKRKELEKRLSQKKVETDKELSLKFNEGLDKIKDQFSGVLKDKIDKILKINLLSKDTFTVDNKEYSRAELHQKLAIDLMDFLTKDSSLMREFIQAIPKEKRQAFIDNFSNFVKSNAIENNDKKSIELAENFKIKANKYIDIVVKDGKTKIIGKNGYALEIAYSGKELQKIMQNPINVMSNKERAEFTDKKIELKTQINDLDGEIKNLDDIINNVKLLKELQQNPEENKEKITQLEKILSRVQLLREITSIDGLENFKRDKILEKEKLEMNLKKLESKFNTELERRYRDKSKDGYEQEIKTRQTLQFLDNIGFSIIPQDITNLLLNFIKINKLVINENMGGDKLESGINLSKGMFGGNPRESVEANKKVFLTLFNKMISGKPDEPLTATEIYSIAYKNEYGRMQNRTSLTHIFKENGILKGSAWNIHKFKENLIKK